jgi:hypothetical protein
METNENIKLDTQFSPKLLDVMDFDHMISSAKKWTENPNCAPLEYVDIMAKTEFSYYATKILTAPTKTFTIPGVRKTVKKLCLIGPYHQLQSDLRQLASSAKCLINEHKALCRSLDYLCYNPSDTTKDERENVRFWLGQLRMTSELIQLETSSIIGEFSDIGIKENSNG